MKAKIITAFILMGILLTGCKDENSVDNLEVVKPQLVENNFKVTISAIVKKDDTFSLFYTEDGTTDFSKSEPLWMALKGNDNEQEVKFTLPEDVFPTQLRLDFGMAKDQEDIILKRVTIEHKGNKRDISGLELGNFFQADLNKCTFDATTGVIKAVVKNGVREFPSLYPNEVTLKPEIEKLAK